MFNVHLKSRKLIILREWIKMSFNYKETERKQMRAQKLINLVSIKSRWIKRGVVMIFDVLKCKNWFH